MSFEDKLYPPDVAISANLVLKRHHAIIEKYGLKLFLQKRQFQRAKEMFEAAVYAIGMTAKYGHFYWVIPGKKNETPDAYIIHKTEERTFNAECLEITSWEEHNADLGKIIEKKINKSYPSNFVILIHVSREGDNQKAEYYEKIHQNLKQKRITAGAVRIWWTFTNKPPKDTLIGELYPSNDFTEFQAQEILNIYYSTNSCFKIDIYSARKRIIFEREDLNVTLPPLPDWTSSY